MTLQDFKNSLVNKQPHSSWTPYLTSLWYDGNNDWETAHHIIQDMTDKDAAWIHAYLHRKEGDNWNANYWYQRAKQKTPQLTLEKEWEHLVAHFLPKS